MKKTRIQRLICVILILSITILSASIANAGYEGDACYRDGVLGGLEWHTGIVITLGLVNDSVNRIVHAPGGSGVVSYTTLEGFINGNTFKKAAYMSGVTSTTYSNIYYMAKRLADRGNITYTALGVLPHNSTGTWIYPDNITKSRCDGVTEYCYEYYGVKVMSIWSDYNPIQEWWDISKVSDNAYHTATAMTPQIQASVFTASHQNP